MAIALATTSCSSDGDDAGSERGPGTPDASSTSTSLSTTSTPASTTSAAMTEDASFCAELDLVEQDAIETGDRISSTDDPLLGFVAAIAGLGDLRTFVARLEAAAPPSIAPDLAAIHESLDPSTAVLTNPVTAIANALVGGLAVSGSYERVDAYSAQACGRPLFGDVTFRPQSTDIRDQFPREQDDLWYLLSLIHI